MIYIGHTVLTYITMYACIHSPFPFWRDEVIQPELAIDLFQTELNCIIV